MHSHGKRPVKLLAILLSCALLLSPLTISASLALDPPTSGLALSMINVSDPFIFADEASQTYYLYASSPDPAVPGVVAYTSADLVSWSGPYVVYNVPVVSGSWWNSSQPALSPEVVLYGGQYYLIVTMQDTTRGAATLDLDNRYCTTFRRSNVLAVADNPAGPFTLATSTTLPLSGSTSYMHRDGTLYVDPDGNPYLVYAHDWIQKVDGNFQAMPLSKTNLAQKAADQFMLFRASLAAFYVAAEYECSPGYVEATIDITVPYKAYNPQIYDMPEGGLVMVWTTDREGKAVVSQSVSRTGNIKGPWEQMPLLFRGDRGAASSFTTFDGDVMLLCQGPGNAAELYDAAVTNNGFTLLAHRGDLDGRSVDITDTLAPKVFPPSTRLVETEGAEAVVTYTAKAYDNIDGWIDVSYSIPSGSVFAKGEHTVTATATDAAGNTSSASFKVIVRDPKPEPARGQYTTRLGTNYTNRLSNLGIHDPYIYYDPLTDHYILHQGTGRNVWRSPDLINWTAAATAYTIVHNNNYMPAGFVSNPERYTLVQTAASDTKAAFEAITWREDFPWNTNSDGNWAAELFPWNGKYYFYTTLHNRNAITRLRKLDGNPNTPQQWRGSYWRASIICVGDSPEGPFYNMQWAGPVTPRDFDTLDATMYVDHDGVPWMVYAHEWIQKCDGTIEAIPMTDDLMQAAGDPVVMFRASYGSDWSEYTDYQWQTQYNTSAYGFSGRRFYTVAQSKELSDKQMGHYVTDGPHVWETPDGSLVCLFTTYRNDEYIQTQLISRTGNIAGPWENAPVLDFDDKGHGMIFVDRDGGYKLVMHNNMGGMSHNTGIGNTLGGATASTSVRAEICDVALTNDGFRIIRHRPDLDNQTRGVSSYTDVLAPLIYKPSSRYATCVIGEEGAIVNYNAYAMDDREGWNYRNPDDVKLTVSHASGSRFPVGQTIVTIRAEDSKGNVSTDTFAVNVSADKSALAAAVSQFASLEEIGYLPGTWAPAAAAYEAALLVLNLDDATQTAVDAAEAALSEAIANLVPFLFGIGPQPPSVVLRKGMTYQIHIDSNSPDTLFYVSSNANVTISPTGLVTAVKTGSTVITVIDVFVQRYFTVTINVTS